MKTKLTKPSVLCLCSGARPWLCARCQRTPREPEKRSTGPSEYREPQPKPVGTVPDSLLLNPCGKRKKSEKVEFVNFSGWLARRGQKKLVRVCWWKVFPRPPTLPPPWLQAGQQGGHLLLSVLRLELCLCPHSSCPVH